MSKNYYIISIILIMALVLIPGFKNQNEIDAEKYKNYVCYDYHLACLDAKESKAYLDVEKDDVSYRIWYRQPNSVDDEKFVCASVRMKFPLASTDLVVMQNPDKYVDVWKEWTITEVEIYYQDINNSKPLWKEDEPSRTPTKIIGTITDTEVFAELVDFVTNDDYSDKILLSEDYGRETYGDGFSPQIYIRVHFEESETIVWDSKIACYVSKQDQPRLISIDKGRTPSGIASTKSHTVIINELSKLTTSISEQIDKFALQ